MKSTKVAGALLGLCVGDALGVPVEFQSRTSLKNNPVVDMKSYGTHNQPAGTWSDDSSMAFCLAESLCRGYDLNDIANTFVKWYAENHWTPHGKVFDIGIATSRSLHKLSTGASPFTSGGVGEHDNGNGSLMRTMPLLFYIKDKPILERYRIVAEVSAITHGHVRSILACLIYLELARQLLAGLEKHQAFRVMQETVKPFLSEYKFASPEEIDKFHRLLENPIGPYEILPLDTYTEDEIRGSGYVVHTLEASIWCLLKTETYAEAVLKAVNLGEDTDTTGCVTGGLAGLYYGIEAIPNDWINQLARKEDIFNLTTMLHQTYC